LAAIPLGHDLFVAGRSAGRAPSALVFAPSPCLTVTIEQRGNNDDIHVHAGGQGFWIARMLATLEIPVTLCGAFGGETGTVIRTLIEQQGISVRSVDAETPNAAYVHDRRGGERTVVSETPVFPLSRHDVDELYGAALVEGLEASITVLGGAPPKVLPDETFRRLARDLRANGGTVVADLSGGQLRAGLEGGIDVLKVSHAELIDDGWADGASDDALVRAMYALRSAGARTVVVSRAEHPALVLDDDVIASVEVPTFEALDHRGAGDSMTAGVAAALADGAPFDAAIRLGAAAGTLNVTRRGLASGERSAIEQLATRVELRPVDAVDSPPAPPTTTPEELATRIGPK
jgi:1-phosphofructokinase